MSYRDFSLKRVQDTFHLSMIEKPGIFAGMEPHPISPFLSETLQAYIDLDDYSIREPDSIIGILLAMVARKA